VCGYASGIFPFLLTKHIAQQRKCRRAEAVLARELSMRDEAVTAKSEQKSKFEAF
jgi:hypothetical protein